MKLMPLLFWRAGLALVPFIAFLGSISLHSATTPYAQDFEGAVGAEWSSAQTESSIPDPFTTFLGRFGNETVVLTLDGLSVGEDYVLSFDLLILDSWDNVEPFHVNIGGQLLFNHTFTYTGSTSYPFPPDLSGVNYGFGGWTDNVFVNIEIPFTANSTTVGIQFTGQNLQPISDESWGLDNVEVALSSEVSSTRITATNLPQPDVSHADALDRAVIEVSRLLDAASAGSTGSYRLLGAGSNGQFGDGDDLEFAVNPQFAAGSRVTCLFDTAPLQPGRYRFETLPALLDHLGNPVVSFSRTFEIVQPELGRIESLANNTLQEAFPLVITENPGGTQLFTSYLVGTFSATGDVDYARFSAEAGDVISVRVETANLRPRIEIENAAGSDQTTVNSDSSGNAQIQNFLIGTPGTYYIRLSNTSSSGNYKLRLDQSRGPQLEQEPNDSTTAANDLLVEMTQSLYQGQVAGILVPADPNGDFFRLPYLNPGNSIECTLIIPTGSTLTPQNTVLSLYEPNNESVATESLTGSLSHTVTIDGIHFLAIGNAEQRDIRGRYFLQVNITDGVAPTVDALTLPDQGTVTSELIVSFALSFSEYLDAQSVNSRDTYDLRGSGPDGLFDTEDDDLYALSSNYAGGLTAAYSIVNGPLQVGNYRFTVNTSLKDRVDNGMAQAFVRAFTVAGIPNFVSENKNNDSRSGATGLALNPGNSAAGSFGFHTSGAAGTNPYFVASADLDHDGNLDLVTANISSDDVSVFLATGDGFFAPALHYAAGNGPIALALGDLNHDGYDDILVAAHYSNQIAVLINEGNGTFQNAEFVSVGTNPRSLVPGDFNGDTHMDVAVANQSSHNAGVLLGDGTGSLGAQQVYPTGSTSFGIATGDLDKDSIPDLLVVNAGANTMSLLKGFGDGTFDTAVNIPTGNNPRSVGIGDLDGDGNPDAAVISAGDRMINIHLGNGDGSFMERATYPTGANDPYHVQLGLLDDDALLDVAVANYGSSRVSVFLNTGEGVMGPVINHPSGSGCIALAIGDFNLDGLNDIATGDYGGSSITLLGGMRRVLLTENPAGSGLRSGAGRGRITGSGDTDHWYFTGQSGSLLNLSVETPGLPSSSSLNWYVERPDGSQLTSFNSASSGYGQSSPVALPMDGAYWVRVRFNNAYTGEYRLRVTLVDPGIQMESESNDSIGAADAPEFGLSETIRSGSVYGYFSVDDVPGDFYRLGYLAPQTDIRLTVLQPSTGGFSPVLQIINAAGEVVGLSEAGAVSFDFTVPEGAFDLYYARILPGATGYSSNNQSAIRFDGNNDYVNTGAWSPGPQWTIEAWVNASSLPAGRRTIAGGFGGCLDWGITMQDGEFGVAIRQPGGCSLTLTSGETVLPGQWYHVAAVNDGALARLYINGVLKATGAVDPNYVGYTGGARIGSETCCGGNSFPGTIDEVRFWDVPLEQGELLIDPNSRLNGDESGLVGYYPFDAGFGSVAVDLSNSNRDGTLTNGADWIGLSSQSSIPPGLFAEYRLTIEMESNLPPQITSVTLPEEGTQVDGIIDRFSLGFSEDMIAETVDDPAGYQLRNAGTDEVFDTEDDRLYEVASGGYGGGLINHYTLPDGPLQPGLYRFTVFTSLKNRGGIALASPFTRAFEVLGVDGFILENRSNHSAVSGTSLSVQPQSETNGSFTLLNEQGVGTNPYFVASGLLNGDTIPDLVTANISSQNISVLIGKGDGSFEPAVHYPASSGPIALALGDVNGDGNVDICSVNHYASNISIFLGNGDGTFGEHTTFQTGSNPRSAVMADFNGDSKLDIAVANQSSANAGVLIGDGQGGFAAQATYGVGSGPFGIDGGDFDKDGVLDLVVVNSSTDNMSFLKGVGDGTFGASVSFPAGDNPRSIAVGDLDADGNLDAVTISAGDRMFNVLFGSGDGQFSNPVSYATGVHDPYHIRIGHLDGDDALDVGAAHYGSSRLSVFRNQGDGQFFPVVNYPTPSGCIALAIDDFNQDGRMDIATAHYGANSTGVFLGNPTERLVEDPVGSGLFTGAGRGNVSSGSDVDYWTFTGQKGDRLVVAVQTLEAGSSRSLTWRVESPERSTLTSFTSHSNGYGQNAPVTLPHDGTYYLYVVWNHAFTGEYRLRVTLAKPPIQLESEGNDSINASDALGFVLEEGAQRASVLGYLGLGDSNGDFYLLGNLSPNTQIILDAALPASSPLIHNLSILRSSGSQVAASEPGAPQLSYTVPEGQGDTYYAKVTADSGLGFFSQYLLGIQLADVLPPQITSDTLPQEGSVNDLLLDRFSLGFSEDMTASSVLDSGNYQMKSAGADRIFDTEDDAVYTVQSTGYGSGLSSGYFIPDGPLQPGSYRFTATTGLQDRSMNPLENPYVRFFEVTGVDGFFTESRDNNGVRTSDTLSSLIQPGPDGSFHPHASIGSTGSNPYFIEKGDFNKDGLVDLVTANISGDNVTFFAGLGNGQFEPGVGVGAGNGPIALAVGDVNSDSHLDVITANHYSHNVGLLLGNGDGTFQAVQLLPVGNNPRSVKLADLNADGAPDVVTANSGTHNISVIIGNGDGTFQSQVAYPVGNSPYGIIPGDFNGDGALDLAVTNSGNDHFSYLEALGDGTFKAGVTFDTGDNPWSIDAGDLNGDGHLDIVLSSANDTNVNVHLGQGNGTFADRMVFESTGTNPYHVKLVDLDLDGVLDVVTANYGTSRLSVLFGNGDGRLRSRAYYPSGNGAIAVVSADFNGDGIPDLASAHYGGNDVSVLLGRNKQPLSGDPDGSGVFIGTGRGKLADTSDADYWSFSANAGDRFLLGVETREPGGSRSLVWQLFQPDGERLFSSGSRSDGYGFIERTLPLDGTYHLVVSYNHQFFDEYRFRVTLAKPEYQIESEGNDNQNAADGVDFKVGESGRTAQMMGFLNQIDSSGDWFSIGTLAQGTTVNLSLNYPASSGLSGIMALFSGSNQIEASEEGSTGLTHQILQNDNSVYYVRITGTPETRDLFSQYILGIQLQDLTSPEIVGDTLPADQVDHIIAFDGFSLSFTEDMDPLHVNDSGHYEMRSAGVDGLFNTLDDELYRVLSSGYTSGLTASFRIDDGPLSPGSYRFTVSDVLSDLFGNPLPGDYQRTFRIIPLEGYRMENRNNQNVESATSLSLSPTNDSAGSFRTAGALALGQSNPYDIRSADLNGDGYMDLITANHGSNSISVLIGQGDGGFAEPVYYPTGHGPIRMDLADLNGDGFPDVGIANFNSNDMTIRLGLGNGGFGEAMQLPTGTRPNGIHFADLNKDTFMDVVAANRDSDDVTVRLGSGAGSFGESRSFASGDGPAAVVSLDANADGNPDLAVVHYNEHRLSILFGDGAGGFGEPVQYVTGNNPYHLVGLDYDLDGNPDLVVVNLGSHTVSFFKGKGDGTFMDKTDVSSGGSNPYNISVADLNGDGFDDLLVSNYGSSKLGVLLHNGSNGFQSLIAYSAGSGSISAVGDDFNQDGIPDVATANYGAHNVGLFYGVKEEPLNPDGVISGLLMGRGRGKLFDSSDYDYWTFSARAGQQLVVASETPGNPSGSSLYYRVDYPNGDRLVDYATDHSGRGQSSPVIIPSDGLYSLRVSYNHHYFGEYRFRLTLVDFPFQSEHENNGGVGNATNLGLEIDGENRRATAVGYTRENGDLDYFNLGEIESGSTVFLNALLPALSEMSPVVSLYDSNNGYVVEAGNGRPFDSVAEVRITQTGSYYALIRNSEPVGGLPFVYALDIQVLPTSSVAFPNLQVTEIIPPPNAPLVSGTTIETSFAIRNVGSVETEVSIWTDKLVLSGDSTLGNVDDFTLGIFTHSGSLTPGQGYSVTRQVRLPDGIQGNYRFIVQTDSGNAVNEFVLEGDNISVSTESVQVQRAPYPDLVVEDLTVTGPDGQNRFDIAWNTANRGDGLASGGFSEQVLVRNLSTGQVLTTQSFQIGQDLPVGGIAEGSLQVTAVEPGVYKVFITTDHSDDFFEFGDTGHASAEQNTFEGLFQIIEFFNVLTSSNPEMGGSTGGGGNYPSGSEITVHAVADTSNAPYRFSHWTENGVFQSAEADYSFVLSRNRQLVAQFLLPLYAVTGINVPSAAGTIVGLGNYIHGSSRLFTARPNPGYNFVRWEEGENVLGTDPGLNLVIQSARQLRAVYEEANPTHDVVLTTNPPGLAVLSGGGTYGNGESVALSAPVEIVESDTVYTFHRFLLNGAVFGTSSQFTKTFSTVDPGQMSFVAEYRSSSLRPVVKAVNGNLADALGNPLSIIPATDRYRLSIRFDRSMDTGRDPQIMVSSDTAANSPTIPGGGEWVSTLVLNDTYLTPFLSIQPGMDGAQEVTVSEAKDPNGFIMDPAQVYGFIVDATAPPGLVPALSSTTSNSATIAWDSYSAPDDIGGFRIYLSPAPFDVLTGLAPVGFVQSAQVFFTLSPLVIDVDYHAAVVPVDLSGNSLDSVTPLAFRLESVVPPSVSVVLVSSGLDRADLDWSDYQTGPVVGLAGFRLFYETSDFNTVAALSPRAELGVEELEATLIGLDRTQTYFIAVVGFNDKNQFNPNVNTVAWRDPLSVPITEDRTLFGDDSGILRVYEDLVVENNATLTIEPGTTLRFEDNRVMDVRSGRLLAQGTPLDPVVFTSVHDHPGGSPSRGNWKGIRVGPGGSGSVLTHAFVKYGEGLRLDGSTPEIHALTALHNRSAGLRLLQNASLVTSAALIQFNETGIQQEDVSSLEISGSVVANNQINAAASTTGSLRAQGNWWGTLTESVINDLVNGPVDFSPFLSSEPVLTPAAGTLTGLLDVGSRIVPIRLAGRTASDFRISEDSSFAGVFFRAMELRTDFQLSAGGGLKRLFIQFRSSTGDTHDPVTLDLNYITQGPVIQALNIDEGDLLNRPFNIHVQATAQLGMRDIELRVDNQVVKLQSGAILDHRLDIRQFQGGLHRLKISAFDRSGNLTSRQFNVFFDPNPPPAPVITVPAAKTLVNQGPATLSGTAEPFIGLRLLRNGQLVSTGSANPSGQFTFAQAALAEGSNRFVVAAFDSVGSTASSSREILLDSGAPESVVVQEPIYQPGFGLELLWQYKTTGERATQFRVLWSRNPFSSVAEATEQSALLNKLSYTVKGLADGLWYFGVVGYDDALNASPVSALVPFTFDGSAPVITIAFDKPSPVGIGPVRVTLTSNEALAALPVLTLTPSGGIPVALHLVAGEINTYTGEYRVNLLMPSGPLGMRVTARDLLGNRFSGQPQGPVLVLDTTPPVGTITTEPMEPVSTGEAVVVSVDLELTEPAKADTVPSLSFVPPQGDPIVLELTGSGSNWSGDLALGPGQGTGIGGFELRVLDSVDNEGIEISSGRLLEIYTGALPPAPAAPPALAAATASNGRIQLQWIPVEKAESYSVYRRAGASAEVPDELVASGLTGDRTFDATPGDGVYTYAVTSVRLGAQSGPSPLATAVSDNTPPPAPINVQARLVARGVEVSWTPDGNGDPAVGFRIYRNGALIRTVASSAPIIDSPPRGDIEYIVASLDSVGNENAGAPASISMLVGAVTDLQVIVERGQAPVLNWVSQDATVVGFNIYRNGIRQNPQLVSDNFFHDLLPFNEDKVQYAVTSVNAIGDESAARTVEAYNIGLGLKVNSALDGLNNPLVTGYFDHYLVAVSNLTRDSRFHIKDIELRRLIGGGNPMSLNRVIDGFIDAGESLNREIVFPGAQVVAGQSMRVRVSQQTDVGGSTVIYQRTFQNPDVVLPGVTLHIVANQQPLAGGLAEFKVRAFNRSYVPVELIFARQNGNAPGDVYVAVEDASGQEISRTQIKQTPEGALGLPDGSVFQRINPRSYLDFTLPDVLVPEALAAAGAATFKVVLNQVHYQLGSSSKLSTGPLIGRIRSTLTQTAYYGTAQTDRAFYADETPVTITGRAIDRNSGNPLPNTPLKVGFAARGFTWFEDVQTDATGAYRYDYQTPVGFGGKITIWAAHPLVFDELNQAEIDVYKIYAQPSRGEIRMSKNDYLEFSINLLNPGDLPLTGFTTGFEAFELTGEERVPIPEITGVGLWSPDLVLGAGQTRRINLRLTAALDAPDHALVEFRIRSDEGASTTFSAEVHLLEAIPVLDVESPSIGYLEVSLDRGDFVSGSLVIENNGLRDLEGVEVIPPSTDWMTVNLPTNAEGRILLPDVKVGEAIELSVIFSPPENLPLDFYSDFVTVRGSNAQTDFQVGVYALVTSDQNGSVQFYVENILGQPVPNAEVRMRSGLLQKELDVFKTDSAGLVTIEGIQEGEWFWRVSAPGHLGNVGVVRIRPNQTVRVETRLSKNLVTINFEVVPVPYTDRYEIKIEQTFETHVPAPVLVLDPAFKEFKDVTSGFSANFIARAKNEGLIEMTDVTINGQEIQGGRIEPLIEFIPRLLPQQVVEIPFRFTYYADAGGQSAQQVRQGLLENIGNCFVGAVPFGSAANPDVFRGLAAIMNAQYRCISDQSRVDLARALALTYALGQIASSIGSAKEFLVAFVGQSLGCIVGEFLAHFGIGTGSGSGRGSGGPGQRSGGAYNIGGFACFTADTLVTLSDGTALPIADVKEGYSVATGPKLSGQAKVARVISLPNKETLILDIKSTRSEDPESLVLKTTDEHLIWVDGKGWTAAAELKVGDWLNHEEGRLMRIDRIRRGPPAKTVYTLALQGDNVFYANGILVHEACGYQAGLVTASDEEVRP